MFNQNKVKLTNTTSTNYYLELLIKQSKEFIYLVSPYIKLNTKIKELLKLSNSDITIIYGKNENLHDFEFLKSIGTKVKFLENLHTKLYISEKDALLTSLNLYDFSQVNNNELGIYCSKDSYPDLYASMLKQVIEYNQISIPSKTFMTNTFKSLRTETFQLTNDGFSNNISI